MYRAAILTASLVLVPCLGHAQTTATSPGYAYATVEQIPIALAEVSHMHFGVFAPWGQNGWVAVRPLATPPSTGSNVTISSQGFPGRFAVTGTPNAPFSITLPVDRSVTLTTADGHVMVVEYLFSSYNETGVQPVLSSTGSASFSLGGKLLVSANQPPGVYSGSFDLTVAY